MKILLLLLSSHARAETTFLSSSSSSSSSARGPCRRYRVNPFPSPYRLPSPPLITGGILINFNFYRFISLSKFNEPIPRVYIYIYRLERRRISSRGWPFHSLDGEREREGSCRWMKTRGIDRWVDLFAGTRVLGRSFRARFMAIILSRARSFFEKLIKIEFLSIWILSKLSWYSLDYFLFFIFA